MKTCNGCARELPGDSFYKNKHKADGLQNQCKSCMSQRGKDWRRDNPDKALAIALRKYSLTLDDWYSMYRAQGGCCAVCGEAESERARLAVDHDHTCCPEGSSCGSCVRQLVCIRCNSGLGNFRDNPDLLLAAAAYLLRNAVVSRDAACGPVLTQPIHETTH